VVNLTLLIKKVGEKMFEVDANGFTCEFENGDDAINAFLIAVYMVDSDINVSELFRKVKYDLEHSQYNRYDYKNSVSIMQIH